MERFEAFSFIVGCMPSFFVVHDMVIGDASKGTQYFPSQGSTEEYIKTASSLDLSDREHCEP